MDENTRNYVCLSDLHLGAAYSLASRPKLDIPETPPDCIAAFIAALRDTLPQAFTTNKPPTLVLLGDCLDFDFATLQENVDAFCDFIEQLYPPEGPALFDREIIYIPGNHDHRLWTQMEDFIFSKATQNNAQFAATTPLYDSVGIPSRLLNQALENRRQSKNTSAAKVSVSLRYPNWAICNPQCTRQIIFHHGHYLESIYRGMSEFYRLFSDSMPETAAQIELENGPWVNFLWSSLGLSQRSISVVESLYNTMINPGAVHDVSKKMAASLCDWLDSQYGISRSTRIHEHTTLESLLVGLLDATVGRCFQPERAELTQVLSQNFEQGMAWYLSSIVSAQLHEDSSPANAKALDTGFIFGHSHKPFSRYQYIPKFENAVAIMNCGGWVMDSYDIADIQGGAAVFIDSELNTANLRLFQSPLNDSMPAVCVELLDNCLENPLAKNLHKSVQKDLQSRDSKWHAFQATILQRCRYLDQYARANIVDIDTATNLEAKNVGSL